MEKSFSQQTKETLCAIEVKSRCCAVSEMLATALFSSKTENGEIKIMAENEFLVKRLELLSKKFFGSFEYKRLKNCFICRLPGKLRLAETAAENGSGIISVPQAVFDKECCRSAFLRGAFLSGGTITDPKKHYNIEFVTQSKALSEAMARILNEAGLEFKPAKRKSVYVLYTKNSEVICDLLTYMGAFKAQMEILNIKIEREVRNELNRVANGETANMDKIITASIRQIRAIEKIEQTIGIEGIPEELREVAALRKSNKDLSLEELGKKLVPQLSKSGVNHRMKKIIDIASSL